MRFDHLVFAIITVAMTVKESRESDARSRQKRYLLEPTGTQTGLLATIALPLEGDLSSSSVAYFFEGNYYTVDNASWWRGDFEGPEISARSERSTEESLFSSLSRRFVYVVIENNIARQNLPGRACLLRAICEHAEYPFHHNGVLGDVLYIIFTPSTSQDEKLPKCFYDAEKDGKIGNCRKYRKTCSSSVINSISKFAHVP